MNSSFITSRPDPSLLDILRMREKSARVPVQNDILTHKIQIHVLLDDST